MNTRLLITLTILLMSPIPTTHATGPCLDEDLPYCLGPVGPTIEYDPDDEVCYVELAVEFVIPCPFPPEEPTAYLNHGHKTLLDIIQLIQTVHCPTGSIDPLATTIANGQTQSYENGTYSTMGGIRVQDGGTLRIVNATLEMAGPCTGITVESGATLDIIDQSHILGSTPMSRITLENNSLATIHESKIQAVTLAVMTYTADIHRNNFTASQIAVILEDVDVNLTENKFYDNILGVSIRGGAPTLYANQFLDDKRDVDVEESTVLIRSNTFHRSDVGLAMARSGGRIDYNEFKDRADPVTNGTVINDAAATTYIKDNHYEDWGTAIQVINGNGRVYEERNTFTNNNRDAYFDPPRPQ